MKKYLLALDEGTTSTRCILFDDSLRVVQIAQHEFPQIYPKPGWVEHDPVVIWANQYAAMNECIAASGVDPEEIAGIGITNQRETTVVWDKQTGKPVCNAIVWQCRRTAELCERLEADGWGDYIQSVTGLRPDAYFSGTKIKWILDHVDGARRLAEDGRLLFGTIDTWLLWKLTGGKVHATDATNASRTMLFDINRGVWDEKLLDLLTIPRSMLPEVRSSGEIYGYVDIMGTSIPVCGMAGDQQAALFGQCCFDPGDIKNTYGTGCFLLANTGDKRVTSRNGLITTLGATLKDEPTQYVLEGSVFVGGAVVQWLREELHVIHESRDSEYFASKLADNGGVYVVPAFSGLGAPYWDMHARGSILGLTRGTGTPHIIRAALESIAYQTEDLIAAMEADFGGQIHDLKVDGGASKNNFLMQFQSDISDLCVRRSAGTEATAMGAAFLAGLAIGFFRDREDIMSRIGRGTVFTPEMSDEKRQSLLDGWHRAVSACRAF